MGLASGIAGTVYISLLTGVAIRVLLVTPETVPYGAKINLIKKSKNAIRR